MKKKNKNGSKPNFLEGLLWWRVRDADLNLQVKEYHNLSVFKSARGQSALALGFSAVVTTALINFTSLVDAYAYIDVAVLTILALLIFKGKRWAMVAAMVLWTLEKLIIIIGAAPGGMVTHLLWWTIYMSFLFKAWKVEGVRNEKKSGKK